MWGRKKQEQHGGPPFSPLAEGNGFALAEPAFPSSSFPPSTFGVGAEMPSLRETVKKRLLTDIIRGFASEPAGVVMLVDKFTLRVVSAVCKMSELLDENIHLVENITMKQDGEYLKRQPLPVRACLCAHASARAFGAAAPPAWRVGHLALTPWPHPMAGPPCNLLHHADRRVREPTDRRLPRQEAAHVRVVPPLLQLAPPGRALE